MRSEWSSDEEVPEEPSPRTSAVWKPDKIDVFKYVDDGLQVEKINMETAVRFERGGKFIRSKHAVPSQNVFRHVIRRATDRGMKVNAAKTKLLCVSDALSYLPEVSIKSPDDSYIVTKPEDSLKMLCFHFSTRPTVNKHIEVLKKRFRARYWILIHLRNAGFNVEELVRVYKVILRPVHDYLA